MSLNQSGNTLTAFAAGLGIFQGLVWTILAVLGIVARFDHDPNWTPTHSQTLNKFLVGLIQNDGSFTTLNGLGLFIVAIVYLIISVFWVILSSMLFISIKAQRPNYSNKVRAGWGVLTLVICIYDMIVAAMLGDNYRKYLEVYNYNHNAGYLYILIGYGTLFTLAARGYVLWIINLVLSTLMLISPNQKTKANTDVYYSNTIDGRNHPGHTNRAYGWEREEPRFDSRPPSGNHNYPGGDNSRMEADRVAGLGKQDPRSYPKNVLPPKPPANYRYASPNVPQPDYSPPHQQSPPPPNSMFNRNERY
ncbi:uncharacterized protein LOC116158870 [Photinus pyralis]|nr:uncharacterized protein LOC116158870 [Photinus pyralis]